MNKLSPIISGAKYVYLTCLFALFAGFFHPLVRGLDFSPVIVGILVLFVGLGGAILVFKATESYKRQTVFMASGLSLIAVSLVMILQLI